jgi:hypothetical protein
MTGWKEEISLNGTSRLGDHHDHVFVETFGFLHLVKEDYCKHVNQQLMLLTIWHLGKEDVFPYKIKDKTRVISFGITFCHGVNWHVG